MKVSTGKLSRKQNQVIAALLEMPTMREVAEAVGIGETTLFRWLKKEDFQNAYREAKRRVIGLAINRLQKASSEAVQTLTEIMNDVDSPTTARVTAAKTVLEMAFKAIEGEDLEARIAALEKIVREKLS